MSPSLLKWYDTNQRLLPWRGETDPYRIWVSEVLLVQTRVETAIPYYRSFLERFPTLQSLAEASEQEVLQVWQGLGYYRRAQHLLAGARYVRDHFSGCLPNRLEEIRSIPGIGPYMAAAILSIAYGVLEPALDGNALRVASRWLDLHERVDRSSVRARIHAQLLPLLDTGYPGDFNQAVMELGATLCIPKSPRCRECPVRDYCRAFAAGTAAELPIRTARRQPYPVDTITVLVAQECRYLVRQRPQQGILAGMWEYPTTELPPDKDKVLAMQDLLQALSFRGSLGKPWWKLEAYFTHCQWHMEVFRYQVSGHQPEPSQSIRWLTLEEIAELPMGNPCRRITLHLRESLPLWETPSLEALGSQEELVSVIEG